MRRAPPVARRAVLGCSLLLAACGWADLASRPDAAPWFDGTPAADAGPVPADAGGVSCDSELTCSQVVSASEPASVFNERLATEGAVVCLEASVTVSGPVAVGADGVVIAGLGEPLPRLVNDAGDALLIGGHTGVTLRYVSIESSGPELSSALAITDGGGAQLLCSHASCTTANCYITRVDHSSLSISDSRLEGGNDSGGYRYSYGVYGYFSEVIVHDSSVVSQGSALADTTSSHFAVTGSDLTGLDVSGPGDSNGTVEVYNATLELASSTVRTAAFAALYASGNRPGVTVTLDNSIFGKAAGLPAGGVSPLVSGRADIVFDSSQPNIFCNEGTSTTDGAFTMPWISGPYDAATSTFDDQAQVGPIDCDAVSAR